MEIALSVHVVRGVFCQISPDVYWTDFHNLFTIWKLFDLVNFRPVISEFTLLKRAIFAAMHPQF